MARTNGPIQVWSRTDTTPTDVEGGYAGGDSTAAAVGTSLDQSSKALGTVNNMAVTASTLDYGQEASATISGESPWKTIHVGIPKGMPDSVGQQLTADAAASADAAALARDDADAAVLLAQQAQAAAYNVPDVAMRDIINNPATETRGTLDGRYGAKGNGVARFLARARSGEDMTVGVIGDSIGAGYGLTSPTTERWTSLTIAALESRHGVTLTEVNEAVASYTAFRAFIGLKVEAVIDAAPDLVIIQAFDKNDIGADVDGPYTPGYALPQSTAAIERMVRVVREQAPQADVVLVSTNPYTSEQTVLNAAQQAKDAAVERLAAVYGCEYVNGYQAFIDYGDYDPLVPDGTHPNAAGNQVLADAVMSHFPDGPRHALGMADPPKRGVYSPEVVDTSVGTTVGQDSYGFMGAGAPGTRYDGRFVWTETGAGWATVGSDNETSTAGDYAEFVFYGTELDVMVDTSDAAAAVVDVTVDGTLAANDQPLNLGKDNGLNYVTFAADLAPGWHTVRLTVVSGTLRINVAYALAAPAEALTSTPSSVVLQDLMSDTNVIPLTASTAWTIIDSATLTLPDGWSSAAVTLSGVVSVRAASTTTKRDLQTDVYVDGVSAVLPQWSQPVTSIAPTTPTFYQTMPVSVSFTITADALVEVMARPVSTDKDGCSSGGIGVRATLIRTG